MGLEMNDSDVDDYMRIGRPKQGGNRPILLKLMTQWKKREILKATGKLKNTKIFVEDDLTKEEVEEKKGLVEDMMEQRKLGKYAVIRNKKLYVDGKMHFQAPTKAKFKPKEAPKEGTKRTTNKEKLTMNNLALENTPRKDGNELKRKFSPDREIIMSKKSKNLQLQRALGLEQKKLEFYGINQGTSTGKGEKSNDANNSKENNRNPSNLIIMSDSDDENKEPEFGDTTMINTNNTTQEANKEEEQESTRDK
uniref:Uncharacterized protein n=2 Tax=Cacopsylla melanoneura TaxID=428564 RepID=A0A8D8VZW6_9HEMI